MNREIDVSISDNNVRYVPKGINNFCGLAHETRYNWVFEKFNLKNKKILDLGCGSGYGSEVLAKDAKKVLGVDYSKKAIEFAKKSYQSNNLYFMVGDVCSKEIVQKINKKFDMIISFDVIEHLEKYFDFLENITKLLKRNGILIIGCPNRLATFKWNRKWNEFHKQEFTPYQLKKILSLYFYDVEIGSQDFKDPIKKRKAREINYGSNIIEKIKILLPPPLILILKKIKYISKKNKSKLAYKYSDIEFLTEPPKKILENAFGLIALCKKKKNVKI